ncbi:hypothetical protein SGPA1_60203 [Streptomyces misionensis JCM 4497]
MSWLVVLPLRLMRQSFHGSKGRPAGPRHLDVRDMLFGPDSYSAQGDEQRAAQRGQSILDAGRILVVLVTTDQTVGLQGAQGLGQGFRGDAPDMALQLAEPAWSAVEGVDDEHGPPGADAVQHRAARAGRCHHVVRLTHCCPQFRCRYRYQFHTVLSDPTRGRETHGADPGHRRRAGARRGRGKACGEGRVRRRGRRPRPGRGRRARARDRRRVGADRSAGRVDPRGRGGTAEGRGRPHRDDRLGAARRARDRAGPRQAAHRVHGEGDRPDAGGQALRAGPAADRIDGAVLGCGRLAPRAGITGQGGHERRGRVRGAPPCRGSGAGPGQRDLARCRGLGPLGSSR